MTDTVMLETTLRSKEYNQLVKCSKKHCSAYSKLLEKEQQLADKLIKVNDEIEYATNTKEIISKTKQVMNIQKEIVKLGTNKEAIRCAMTKCTNEFNDLIAFKSDLMVKQIDQYKAMMKKK